MRSRHLLLALGLALAVSPPSPAGETANAEKIDKLIEQMGSGAFAEREKATKELDAIGMPALAALRKAVKSDDAEVRKRAEELVKKIEKQAESAAILAPKRLHLVYKDTPLREAVADFENKCGYTIHLHDPDGKLKGRKITLDTGETTFWHAYERFCDKAGLTETTMQDLMGMPRGVPMPVRKPPVRRLPPQRAAPAAPPAPGGALAAEKPAVPPPPPPPEAPRAVKPLPAPPPPIAAAVPGMALPGRVVMPFDPVTPGFIMLKDGKRKQLPTDDRSAVRVRALPKADMFGASPAGEVILALEVSPEPKLQWQGMQSIRIDKALDDQGQKLSQITPQIPAGPGFRGGVGGFGLPPGAMMPAGMMGRPMGWGGGQNQPVPVQLKKGEKAAKSLKELTGVLAAHVLSEAKPMITADKLAQAAGKTFKGEEGGTIKIIAVKTDKEKKTTTIQFELEQPPNAIADTPRNRRMPGVGVPIRVPRPAIRIQPVPAPPPPAAQAPAAKPPGVRPQVQLQVRIGGGQGNIVFAQPAIAFAGPAFVGPYNGVSVRDEKGNALPIQMGPQQFRILAQPGGGFQNVLTYTFICQPGKDQGQPAQLVYAGRKRVTIDIPFTLKDVPLP